MNPIKLFDVRISGFAAANSTGGNTIPVVWKAALTSDQAEFYAFMEGASQLISERATAAQKFVLLNNAAALMLVAHNDGTADLYVNDLRIAAEVLGKKDAARGQVITEAFMADIRRVRVLDVSFEPSDKVLVCFKVGWKFALYFDLGDERSLDVDEMEKSLAHLYRVLTFEDAYAALNNESVFKRLVQEGWFPFIEILGAEFRTLFRSYRDDFNVEGQRRILAEKFDEMRVEELTARWWKRPALVGRDAILKSAIAAYQRKDWIACLKVLLTEIEGILRDAHIVEKSSSASIHDLLRYAADRGIRKAEGEATLFFPREFLIYLRDWTFGKFDPVAGTGVTSSRHGVGHGAAKPEDYTQERAIQAILTVDQISFYL